MLFFFFVQTRRPLSGVQWFAILVVTVGMMLSTMQPHHEQAHPQQLETKEGNRKCAFFFFILHAVVFIVHWCSFFHRYFFSLFRLEYCSPWNFFHTHLHHLLLLSLRPVRTHSHTNSNSTLPCTDTHTAHEAVQPNYVWAYHTLFIIPHSTSQTRIVV